jgi:hypothetical protein
VCGSIDAVARAQDVPAAKAHFERKLEALVGQVVASVAYWDIHNWGDEPRTWDYGEWHHAVMGVELMTNVGRQTIIWTDTFFPYGVEVFPDPIAQHLRLAPEGPEGWQVETYPEWRARSHGPVVGTATFWEHFDVGPARLSDGTVVGPAESHDVPVAIRLDFADGPVWFVAGSPQYPDMDLTQTFLPGDEIMVVFTPEAMRSIGFPQTDFIKAPTA